MKRTAAAFLNTRRKRKTFCRKKSPIKHTIKAATGAKIHPSKIFPKTAQFILATPFKMDMPIMAPTTACELETGTNGIVGKPRFNKNVSRIFITNIKVF